jgi:hypothetical protein
MFQTFGRTFECRQVHVIDLAHPIMHFGTSMVVGEQSSAGCAGNCCGLTMKPESVWLGLVTHM